VKVKEMVSTLAIALRKPWLHAKYNYFEIISKLFQRHWIRWKIFVSWN